MIELNVNGERYEIRNEPKEITLREYEYIQKQFANREIGRTEKYWNIFKFMGVPENILDALEDDFYNQPSKDEAKNSTFAQLVQAFGDYSIEAVYHPTIEINGKVYRAYDGERFKLSVRDRKEIERCAMKEQSTLPVDMMAIIYKEEGAENHYSPSHLDNKRKLFRKHMTADYAIPYIKLLAQRTVNQLDNVE
jgi:hypothetical protein